MQSQLYQWSLGGLAASVAMIAVFFVTLSRSIRLVELRWWTYAWFANGLALVVSLIFWLLPSAARFTVPLFGVYLPAKLAYVWLLAGGSLEAAGTRPKSFAPRIALPVIVIGGVLGVILYANTLDTLGVAASGVIAVGLGATAIALLAGPRDGRTWLIFGLAARAVLGAVEGAAYVADVIARQQPNPSNFLSYAATLLAVHTSLDTGAEWLLALGCVMAVSQRMQAQMRQANAQLLEAQEGLRQLVDRDPLTTLANRRTLPEVFRRVQPEGALLLFFDLNGFKQINDRHGHAAGDECLKRFSAALSESFRPGDAVIRYAGDEFLVVATGLDEAGATARVESLAARMLVAGDASVPVRFSWGISQLAPGGRPDAALRAADESMYRAKAGAAT